LHQFSKYLYNTLKAYRGFFVKLKPHLAAKTNNLSKVSTPTYSVERGWSGANEHIHLHQYVVYQYVLSTGVVIKIIQNISKTLYKIVQNQKKLLSLGTIESLPSKLLFLRLAQLKSICVLIFARLAPQHMQNEHKN
jgi:hypothetical protein